jgi:hypothetical protein
MGAVKAPALLITLLFLAACDRGETPVQAQRISLDDARARQTEPLASPDTRDAAWTVRPNGQAIDFGKGGGPPLLSLECRLRQERIAVVRHAPARPGQEALFPVIGNGLVSRFKVDATLADREWRWEGLLPVADAQLDVFVGQADLQATLPGGGMLAIAGSRIPGEFVTWCRSGGELPRVEADEPEASEKASSAPPAQ